MATEQYDDPIRVMTMISMIGDNGSNNVDDPMTWQ
jgi:hypothetical protein